jgi:pilus assembly protein Flp/PilA
MNRAETVLRAQNLPSRFFRRRVVAAKVPEIPASRAFVKEFANELRGICSGHSSPGGTNKRSTDMIELAKRFAADESGATAIEYGLIAAGISVAIITVVQGLGTKLNSTFGAVKNALK